MGQRWRGGNEPAVGKGGNGPPGLYRAPLVKRTAKLFLCRAPHKKRTVIFLCPAPAHGKEFSTIL
jgi:hypothetical protein